MAELIKVTRRELEEITKNPRTLRALELLFAQAGTQVETGDATDNIAAGAISSSASAQALANTAAQAADDAANVGALVADMRSTIADLSYRLDALENRGADSQRVGDFAELSDRIDQAVALQWSGFPAMATETFTPTVQGTTAAGAGTYSVQIGRYFMFGPFVFFMFSMTYTGHTGTGNMRIAGFPIAAMNVTNSGMPWAVFTNNLTVTGQTFMQFNPNAATADLFSMNNGASAALAIDAAATIIGAGFYERV